MENLTLTKKYVLNTKAVDSGIEWIGKSPSNWKATVLRGVAKENIEKNANGENHNLLSLSYGSIITKDINGVGGLLPESFNTYQIVRKGDIVLRLTDLQNDKKSLRVGFVNEESGIITSAYLALNITKTINSKFIYYLLHSYDLQKVFYNLGGGVRQTLDYNSLKYLPIVFPDLELQEKIVSFLDDKIAFINSIINNKQKQIKLLREKRSALIKHVVTKGLTPKEELVESGIGWIGRFPKAWKIYKLRQIAKIKTGTTPPKANGEDYYADSGLVWAKPGDLNEFSPIYSSTDYLTQAAEKIVDVIPEGSVLVNCIGDIGSMGVAGVNLATNQQINSVIFDKNKVNTGYGKYLVFASAEEMKRQANTVVVSILNKTQQGSIPYPVPPLNKQVEICDYLDKELKQYDEFQRELIKSINLQQELKASLISHLITGKICL